MLKLQDPLAEQDMMVANIARPLRVALFDALGPFASGAFHLIDGAVKKDRGIDRCSPTYLAGLSGFDD